MTLTAARLLIATTLFTIATQAGAMSAIEFVKLDMGSPQRQALEPIVFSFVSRGYKDVPDWPKLSNLVRARVLEKGYTYQSLETVAEEAAVAAGMHR